MNDVQVDVLQLWSIQPNRGGSQPSLADQNAKTSDEGSITTFSKAKETFRNDKVHSNLEGRALLRCPKPAGLYDKTFTHVLYSWAALYISARLKIRDSAE